MNIYEYVEISKNVKPSDMFCEGLNNALRQIHSEKNISTKSEPRLVLGKWTVVIRAAVIFCVAALLAGGGVISVRAYLSHMERIRSLNNEEVVYLYENIFKYDSKDMSRSMTENEENRFIELWDLFCMGMVDPKEKVSVIEIKSDYSGVGIAFSQDDGILYLPAYEMSDEEILQVVEFCIMGNYVDYETYMKATDSQYYLNDLDKMTSQEIDKIYIDFYTANAETSFFSRDLTFDEMGRKRVLKELYKKGLRKPEQGMCIIKDRDSYEKKGIAFCSEDCTYYIPDELTDEDLLELIDYQIKVDYCLQRIADEINRGIRNQFPHVEYVVRERIETIDLNSSIDNLILSQNWLKAYTRVIEQYFEINDQLYENAERYYVNVRFIYLNDDDIPEMLISYGCIDTDYCDNSNVRNYIYTYKDNEAVLLSPDEDSVDSFYGYDKGFSYVERKGMVYCDYHYLYGFSSQESGSNMINDIRDNMSRIDFWNFDTLTHYSTNSNIKMLIARYDYVNEEYTDASFSFEYYINVSKIIRDEYSGEILEIVGEKVNRLKYEEAEDALWGEETVVTLTEDDYDKIYCDYAVNEALVRCFMKLH